MKTIVFRDSWCGWIWSWGALNSLWHICWSRGLVGDRWDRGWGDGQTEQTFSSQWEWWDDGWWYWDWWDHGWGWWGSGIMVVDGQTEQTFSSQSQLLPSIKTSCILQAIYLWQKIVKQYLYNLLYKTYLILSLGKAKWIYTMPSLKISIWKLCGTHCLIESRHFFV